MLTVIFIELLIYYYYIKYATWHYKDINKYWYYAKHGTEKIMSTYKIINNCQIYSTIKI